MTVVLDASAVWALINEEPGGEKVRTMLDRALISSLNFAEVGTRLVDLGHELKDIAVELRLLGFRVVPFDEGAATRVVELRASTRQAGLSLADRACLALAIREDATALTADRAWADLEVGCLIEVIR